MNTSLFDCKFVIQYGNDNEGYRWYGPVNSMCEAVELTKKLQSKTTEYVVKALPIQPLDDIQYFNQSSSFRAELK